MNFARLARRYARALLSLTRETADATSDELARAAAALEEPRARLVLLSPVIDAAVRVRTARQLAEALRLSPMVANLIGLLAERDRLAILPDTARAYDELVDEQLGRVRAVIRSATPLSGAEKTELTELARRLTGKREVVATTEIDPDLLGGVVLDIAGTVYDGSLRAQLLHLSRQMATSGA